MRYFKLLYFICLLASAQTAMSETIWCKAMNLGCMTTAEKEKLFQKELRNCENLSNGSYREGLNEALANDTVWKFAGSNSAQDYANMRKNLMFNICMKRVHKNSQQDVK